MVIAAIAVGQAAGDVEADEGGGRADDGKKRHAEHSAEPASHAGGMTNSGSARQFALTRG